MSLITCMSHLSHHHPDPSPGCAVPSHLDDSTVRTGYLPGEKPWKLLVLVSEPSETHRSESVEFQPDRGYDTTTLKVLLVRRGICLVFAQGEKKKK